VIHSTKAFFYLCAQSTPNSLQTLHMLTLLRDELVVSRPIVERGCAYSEISTDLVDTVAPVNSLSQQYAYRLPKLLLQLTLTLRQRMINHGFRLELLRLQRVRDFKSCGVRRKCGGIFSNSYPISVSFKCAHIFLPVNLCSNFSPHSQNPKLSFSS